MANSRPCPGCHRRGGRPFGSHAGFSVLSCTACGTLFTARLPEIAESEDYDAYYHSGNLEVPDFVRGRLGEIVAAFDGNRRLNRWLDVGCGAGTLLQAAAARGWDVTGTEVAAEAVAHLQPLGLDVRLGELEAMELPRDGFDVISLVEVLEHVSDPDALLTACSAVVRPGGVLYVTTPHGRGISARVLKDGWTVVAPPEHLQLYSVSGIRAAIGRAGLAVKELHTHAVDPRALLAGLRRSSAGAAPAGDERVQGAYELNESLSSSRLGVVAKSAANALLNATHLGDGLKLVAERPARQSDAGELR